MNITININTDGEAFKDRERYELNTILARYGNDIAGVNGKIHSREIYASDGNRCGTVTITESEE